MMMIKALYLKIWKHIPYRIHIYESDLPAGSLVHTEGVMANIWSREKPEPEVKVRGLRVVIGRPDLFRYLTILHHYRRNQNQ